MQSSPAPAGLPDPLSDELRWLRRLSLPLRVAAVALFVNFVLGVVAANFPPRWADPGWYFYLATTIVNGATLPLMGMCLLRVVAFLERGLDTDQSLLERSRYLAFWAALGFALLLPLLGWANWPRWRSIGSRPWANGPTCRGRNCVGSWRRSPACSCQPSFSHFPCSASAATC